MKDKIRKLEKREQRNQERAAKRRQRFAYIFAAIATPVILISAIVLWQLYGPRETSIETIVLAKDACSPSQATTNFGRGDLQAGTQLPIYTDNPPLSGPHLSNPLPDRISRQPATNENLSSAVHSLEHGRVVVYFNNLSADETVHLENLASGERKVILLPWKGLKDKVVLGAWARWQRCNGINEQVILSFINSYRDKGPEFVR